MNLELKFRGGQAPHCARWRPVFGGLALGIILALATVALLTALAAPSAVRAAPFDPAEVAEVRDRVLGDSRYQTELPQPEVREESEPLRLPPWLVEAILWTLGLLAAGLVLYLLVNLLLELLGGRRAFRRKRDGTPAKQTVIETPVTLDSAIRLRTLAEADALAAEGRFGEAIHQLLLVAMDRLRRELGPRVAPALTSREVLEQAPIPGAAVAPLTRMVALSEVKHFGGRDASEPDYQSCRRDFVHFSGGEPEGA